MTYLKQIDEGDGAFYGPKIDISVSDALKRKFQCATLQVVMCAYTPNFFPYLLLELYYSINRIHLGNINLHLGNMNLQLDFQLPARFELYYSAEDEAKRERPVMIHRAILGSVERMFAILLEHYKGKWPFWLSPRQAIVCPVSEKSQSYALKVAHKVLLN